MSTTHDDIWHGGHLVRRSDSEFVDTKYLTIAALGKVTISETGGAVTLCIEGRDKHETLVVLSITREQLCDLACGLWIEEMAEAEQ